MNTDLNTLKNSRGITLVEVLVGVIIGSILLAAGYKSFIAQQTALEGAGDEALIRSKGRLAVKLLAKELRRIGYGVPPNSQIVSINSSSITYRAALSDLQTTIPPGEPGTNGASSGDTSVNVVSADGFADLNNIVIYDPSTGEYEFNYIEGDPVTVGSPQTLPLGDPLTKDFTFGTNSKYLRVNPYNQITISLSGTNIEKIVDGSTQVYVDNVAASTGLVLEYFDANGNATNIISDIQKISVTLNMIDPDNERAFIQFKTDVSLRNIST
jgi:prepilin-type N-terminal cleavage/methylation domain-containing protein